MKGGKFAGFVYDDGGDDFPAFLTYWKFENYVYIEHFAVDPAHRSKNIGRMMLNHLFGTVGENVLIEVEKPTDDESRRRISFYEKRLQAPRGHKLCAAPLLPEQSGVEMLLMTHGDVKLRDTRDLREILTEVYNVDNGI